MTPNPTPMPGTAFWQVLTRATATGCCAALAMMLWERGDGWAAALAAVTAIALTFDARTAITTATGGTNG
jgi:hypothetical protein